MTETEQKTGLKALPWRAILLIAVITLVFVLGTVFREDLKPLLDNLEEFISSLGAWGPLVCVIIYIAWTLTGLPGSLITLLCATLLAETPVIAIITVSAGSTLGAGACFLVSRKFARGSISNWLKESDKFQKLDQLTATHGAVIVAVTRLIPLFPFNLLNYGFGLTRIGFWKYFLVSWVCMMPATIVYVLAGSGIVQALRSGNIPTEIIIVIVCALIVGTVAGVYARKAWRTMSESTGGKQQD